MTHTIGKKIMNSNELNNILSTLYLQIGFQVCFSYKKNVNNFI